MNYLDTLIAVPLLYGLIKGFSNGLIKEITSLLALFIGVYVAINFSSYLDPKFIDIFDGYKEFIPVLSFGILFLVSVLCVKTLGFFVDKLTKALALGVFSKVFGGVFGFLKVIVIFSFLLFVVTDYNVINKQTKEDSVLFDPLTDLAKMITPQLKKHQSILDKIDKGTEKAKEKINQKINPE
ncbi:MAG: CvpA family protein [Flavobacteriales bacterium]|jgi:membrane protein required for colicin V production|nr:CvpA family protein [Flavobacteriales bacterium]MBT5090224.1 CvpA family protein [Flavobacteriales bacterium]